MTDFPSIRTSDWTLFKERPMKKQLRTPFEAGYVQSRAKHTVAKMEFIIGWEWMTRAQYDTLETFFESNQGGSFNFTHPITGSVYVVRFSEEDGFPEVEPMGTDYVKLNGLKLEEV